MCGKKDNNCIPPAIPAQCELGPQTAEERLDAAYEIRKECAPSQKKIPLPNHLSNADENTYPNKIGNYSKGLPHNSLGLVNLDAYHSLIQAISTGNPAQFEKIKLGSNPSVKLTNPQSAFAYELTGPDSHHTQIPPAPSVASAWGAAEMVELYWEALLRDVPFTDYKQDSPLVAAATENLSALSDFKGPKVCVDGKQVVTPDTLFRGNTPGDLIGPYISQFLWQDFIGGAQPIVQKIRCPKNGIDYLTEYSEWLASQNGTPTTKAMEFDSVNRYIRCGRDLAEWIHNDPPFLTAYNACLILLSYGSAALDPSNPYLNSRTQKGFVTFGQPHILDFVVRAARVALEAGWYQKWQVHRKLRPEEFAGLIHNTKLGNADFPINSDVLNSPALDEVFGKYGTYLLPQAYPEAAPTHSAYPSGHACFIGAGVTMLKAFFNEEFIIPKPVVANDDGTQLLPYTGEPLTVLGELNKVAWNVGLGRNFAGIHYRSDTSEGLKLGEAVAIGILQDYNNTYNEPFTGFTITKFDGTTVTI